MQDRKIFVLSSQYIDISSQLITYLDMKEMDTFTKYVKRMIEIVESEEYPIIVIKNMDSLATGVIVLRLLILVDPILPDFESLKSNNYTIVIENAEFISKFDIFRPIGYLVDNRCRHPILSYRIDRAYNYFLSQKSNTGSSSSTLYEDDDRGSVLTLDIEI